MSLQSDALVDWRKERSGIVEGILRGSAVLVAVGGGGGGVRVGGRRTAVVLGAGLSREGAVVAVPLAFVYLRKGAGLSVTGYFFKILLFFIELC